MPPGARGRGPAGVAQEGGPGRAGAEAGGRPQAEGFPASLPPLAAAGPRCRLHGSLPGPSSGPPPFLAAGASVLLSRPSEPGRPEWGAQRFAASRPAAVGTRGAGHCPAPASAMISAKPLPAPPPPPQAAAAMFSFLIPGPATAASGSTPLPCFKCPTPTGACSCCSCYYCAGDSEGPQTPSAPGYEQSLSSAAAAASSVFLTDSEPPPSWFAPQQRRAGPPRQQLQGRPVGPTI